MSRNVIKGCASPDNVRAQIYGVLRAWSMPEQTAAITAELMMQTDLLGIDSHGISMLPAYEEKVHSKALNIGALGSIVQDGPSYALLDGQGGLGHPVSAKAMKIAIEKAKQTGLGLVCVRNSHHFGAAGVYSRMATDEGLLAFVTSSANGVIMVPTGAALPMLGTNPISFAAPADKNEDFVLDMATTTVAANKVKVYDYLNKPLPVGWAVDGEGQPVQDSAVAMDYIYSRPEGGLTPLGGTPDMSSHKGYGLGMMAQILGGTLSGSAFAATYAKTRKPGDPDDVGHFFFVINPDIFNPAGAFSANLDKMINAMHDTPPADPAGKVLVAGDVEAASKLERIKNGVPISVALDKKLSEICQRANTPYMLFDPA